MPDDIQSQFDNVCGPRMEDLRLSISRVEGLVREQSEVLNKYIRGVNDLKRIEDRITDHNAILKDHTAKLGDMSNKIFNGFGATIQSVDQKLDAEVKRSEVAFEDIRGALRTILRVGASAAIGIIIALIGIFGTLLVGDRSSLRELQKIHAEQVRIEELRIYEEDRRYETPDSPIEESR